MNVVRGKNSCGEFNSLKYSHLLLVVGSRLVANIANIAAHACNQGSFCVNGEALLTASKTN
jgi:hypothetical protein